MNIAYNKTWLYNQTVVKETRRWLKHHFISSQQFDAIKLEYPSSFYHPHFVIRLLLFIATMIALTGVIGILIVMMDTSDEKALAAGAILYGVVACFVLEYFFIKNNHHFKSGVTEAILYLAIGLVLGGVFVFIDDHEHLVILSFLFVFVIAAIRYVDLICTLFAIGAFCSLMFYEFYELDGLFRTLIPFIFIFIFSLIYRVAKNLKNKARLFPWRNNLLLVEFVSLLLIYSAGNYLVVRTLSEEMMNVYLQDGQDIPFAVIFYILTAVIPVIYLYGGIKTKDKVLIRISLLLIALSAFTFKYYFSFGHPEVTLTIAGFCVLAITLFLLNYLKIFRGGYTRENLLSEKWGDMNVEAFIISQTIGSGLVSATDQADLSESGAGGEFGGGGSTDTF